MRDGGGKTRGEVVIGELPVDSTRHSTLDDRFFPKDLTTRSMQIWHLSRGYGVSHFVSRCSPSSDILTK